MSIMSSKTDPPEEEEDVVLTKTPLAQQFGFLVGTIQVMQTEIQCLIDCLPHPEKKSQTPTNV
jgi:hypothetical protein